MQMKYSRCLATVNGSKIGMHHFFHAWDQTYNTHPHIHNVADGNTTLVLLRTQDIKQWEVTSGEIIWHRAL